MNQTLANAGRKILKELLAQCTEGEQMMFRRMYAKGAAQMDINEVVDQMGDDRISNAINQCERTIAKKHKPSNT